MPDSDDSGRIANPDRAKLYLDFDSFFASAEQHFNAQLRGKPLGVVPLDVPGTGCIAVSREAKALGVPSSASIVTAREVVPDMIFVVARPDVYVRLHHRILASIESCVPIASVRSIDELVCDLLPSEAARAHELALDIKRTLMRDFSEALTCSIGLAQTELLAKIAAERHKPDGLTILDAQQLPDALSEMALSDIPGVAKGVENRLRRAGVDSVNGLWNMETKRCRAVWGSVEGERFWNALHGYEYERPDTKKRMFGHSRMLPLNWRRPDKVEDCARQLLLSAARRLRRSEMKASKMTFSMRSGGYRTQNRRKSDDKRWSAERSFPAACDDRTLLKELAALVVEYQSTVKFAPRSITVMLHGIVGKEDEQRELFEVCDGAAVLEKRRSEKLSCVLDTLRAQHGPKAATMGLHEPIPGGYLGAKIAFGRIPDLTDFNEATSEDGSTHFCNV